MEFTFWKLPQLYKSMKANEKGQEKFTFSIAGSQNIRVEFEVIFLIDRVPFELLVGAKGYHLAFVLKVWNGFKTELPEHIYYQICEILHLKYSENHFSSATFLGILDQQAPTHCSRRQVQPHEVAFYKKAEIPESEKIYFCGWNNHQADGKTARNFDKTRSLLGVAVAEFCKKNNISSMWSAVPRDRKNYTTPPGFTS